MRRQHRMRAMDRGMSSVYLGECRVTWRFVFHGIDSWHRPCAKWAAPANELSQ